MNSGSMNLATVKYTPMNSMKRIDCLERESCYQDVHTPSQQEFKSLNSMMMMKEDSYLLSPMQDSYYCKQDINSHHHQTTILLPSCKSLTTYYEASYMKSSQHNQPMYQYQHQHYSMPSNNTLLSNPCNLVRHNEENTNERLPSIHSLLNHDVVTSNNVDMSIPQLSPIIKQQPQPQHMYNYSYDYQSNLFTSAIQQSTTHVNNSYTPPQQKQHMYIPTCNYDQSSQTNSRRNSQSSSIPSSSTCNTSINTSPIQLSRASTCIEESNSSSESVHNEIHASRPSRSKSKDPSNDKIKMSALISKQDYRIKKPSRDSSSNLGQWTQEEHKQFLVGLSEVGENYKLISKLYVKTRSRRQIVNHAHKYLKKRTIK